MLVAQRVRKTRLVNPQPKRKVSGAARRRNPIGQIVTMGIVNPQRGKPVQKQKQKTQTKKRRPNPAGFKPAAKSAAKTKPQKRRTKNPSSSRAGKIVARPVSMFKAGSIAALSLLATRQIPQLALGARNKNWLGYLANFLVAIGGAAIAGKMAGPTGYQAALIGGSMYIVTRAANDFSPIGKTLNLSGIGDVMAAGNLSGFKEAYFPMPVVIDRQTGRPIIPKQIVDAVLTQLPAPAAATQPAAAAVTRMSGVGRPGSR